MSTFGRKVEIGLDAGASFLDVSASMCCDVVIGRDFDPPQIKAFLEGASLDYLAHERWPRGTPAMHAKSMDHEHFYLGHWSFVKETAYGRTRQRRRG
jgi:hypothetical protein